MTTSTTKLQCFTCKKETRTFNCAGCTKDFCLSCLRKHVQTLRQELDQIENEHDQFRDKLNDEKTNPKKHQLIKEIDQWEKDSIKIIEQTAKQCRERFMNYTNKFVIKIENKLNNIAQELKQIREENEFNEIDIEQFRKKLNKLQEELNQPTNVLIEQQSTSFINKIFLIKLFDKNTTWKPCGITIAGGKGQGNRLNQLSFPDGIFINYNQTIYIADRGNNRIIEWKYNAISGQIVPDENGIGNEMNQLNSPTDVVIDQETNSIVIADRGNRRLLRWSRHNKTNRKVIISEIDCCRLTIDMNGNLYVSDCENNEVRRWKRGEKNRTLVAGGNGEGDKLNQFTCPTFILVDVDDSLYVSDMNNHRVMKWVKDAKEGIVVAGGNGRGDSLRQLSSPQGVIVDQLGQLYVADECNDRVMRWCKGAKEGTIVVGGNGKGQQPNQVNRPSSLSFDRQGDLYVVDYENHRIQKYELE